MTVDLRTPVLDQGIEHSHFFEGRLLTGRDLRDEQAANRSNRWQLGRAVGAGVVEGLEVSDRVDGVTGDPVLTVEAGLAVNREGQPLELHQRTDVRILASIGEVPEEEIPEDAGVFRTCDDVLDTLVPSGLGLYILVMSPASGFKQSAPKSGLGEGGKVVGCGKRYQVEGVRFRLVRLNPSEVSGIDQATRDQVTALLTADDTASRSRLRNLAAHLCFGTESLAHAAGRLTSDPAAPSPYASYGALDDLLAVGSLTPCDVPLGLFLWSLDGIGFLDLWSVRRRLAVQPRREAEGEAIMLQFQAHIEALRDALPSLDGFHARDHFRYLPAAGLLSIEGPSRGFDPASFFSPLPHRPVLYVNGEQLQEIFRRSRHHDPIDLHQSEMVWLYLPWQQEPAQAAGQTRRATIVFTTGHLPPYATPRFDVARWDFSNYSTGCD